MTQRTIVALSAGLGRPSSTRLLADRLAEATATELADRGDLAEVRVVELRDHAHEIVDAMLTGFPPPALAEVRGRGLMIAVEYREPIAPRVMRALCEGGVLVKDTRGTTVRLLPPLVISRAELDAGLDVAIPILDRA